MRKFLKEIPIIIYLLTSSAIAQQDDTTRSYTLTPIEVTAERSVISETNMDISKERLSGIFESNGFSLIRKGVFFAQDIYADGLKRSDINVVVDGERYHTACPNRMDSPLTRVNPIELESVSLMKTNGGLLSGIGGVVNFHRKVPSENPSFQTGISANTAAQKSVDASFKFEGYSHMATLRYSTGSPYTDSEGRSFKDLYGYTDNFDYTLAEGSFQGNQNSFRYGGSFTYTEDVSFPYLMMDERLNKVFSAFFSYKNNKVYFNYTSHLMDNVIRESKMAMTTAAKNLTLGIVGDFYEVYYRNWDANNNFTQRTSGNILIENNLMPNTKTISAAAHHKFKFGHFRLSGKLGVVNQSMNDKESQLSYNNYENKGSFDRWFPIFGINIDYTNSISNSIGYGFILEAASEAPDLEELYISVNKPMKKPNWSGNPNLDQTIISGLRGMIAYENLSLEIYYSQLWGYVNLTEIPAEKPVQSYENINAQLIGTNFSFTSEFADLNLSYTYGQNLTNKLPLSEIRPFEVNFKLRSPKFWSMFFLAAITYEAEQTRVDPILSESTTPAWYKADIGIKYELDHLKINLMIENVTNQLYYRHLSYLRNPFASGFHVFEPGRNVYLSFTYSI
ncbi:hypothetical protein MNBD_IGNAVI01-2759 [hydrothermal vent metagenome]|uniref:TonB-dependent receptor n=1 Tax=hydrothermal vent metagenome TaxID=652676 RepID=A0A3B1CLG0_9ZZZZ